MSSLRLRAVVVGSPMCDVTSSRRDELIVVQGVVIDDDATRPVDGDVVEIDLGDDVILPGLVNAHDHLHLNAAPGLRPERRFDNAADWIEWLEARLRSGGPIPALAVPLPIRLWHGALKNVLGGATTVAHHDPRHEVLDDPALPVRLAPCGWAHSPGLAGTYGPPLTDSFQDTPPGRPWIVHLAEGTDRRARVELETLDRAGCLGPRTVAVHAVGLDDDGRRRLLERGGSAVWCPTANLSVLGATLDPHAWLDPDPGSRRPLALGTDSRLTGARDMLDELRAAASASGLEPVELARLATVDAARVLRLEHAGRVATGAPADLIVLRAGGDPWRALLEAERADLRAVVLGGRPVIADPDLESWFAACAVQPIRATLDDRPKLVDPGALGPPGAAALEPGLEVFA